MGYHLQRSALWVRYFEKNVPKSLQIQKYCVLLRTLS